MDNYLNKAIKLFSEIRDLQHFLFVVTEFNKKDTSTPSVNCFLKQTNEIKVSLFGSRKYGCGTHKQEIQIPNELRNGIRELAEKLLLEKEVEYKNVFRYSNEAE
jgi:hypothetical protein